MAKQREKGDKVSNDRVRKSQIIPIQDDLDPKKSDADGHAIMAEFKKVVAEMSGNISYDKYTVK